MLAKSNIHCLILFHIFHIYGNRKWSSLYEHHGWKWADMRLRAFRKYLLISESSKPHSQVDWLMFLLQCFWGAPKQYTSTNIYCDNIISCRDNKTVILHKLNITFLISCKWKCWAHIQAMINFFVLNNVWHLDPRVSSWILPIVILPI